MTPRLLGAHLARTLLALAALFPSPAAAAVVPHAKTAVKTVRVFAAASLQDAFRSLGPRFEAEHPGVRLEFNFAGSQVLRTQIEQGAEADLFASADTEHVAALARAGLAEPPVFFAHNRIVVVTPAGNERVRRLTDLARPRVRIVMAGPTVPAGRYADQALAALGRDPAFGAALEAAIRGNVVSLESNVRAVLAKVQLGEADAGFVYETDARAAGVSVRVITLPPCAEVRTAYAVAVLRAAHARPEALAFLNDLLGAEARALLHGLGFRP
jgi:molybdate transport system substrate-binding protein